MNRQSGMSSLLLVMLILALGSLTLQGMSAQQQSRLTQTSIEVTALKESASSETLLAWGRVSDWPTEPAVECRQLAGTPGSVCLRHFSDETVVLIASSGLQRRWQTGTFLAGVAHFDANGWSDFCPRKEAVQCDIP